VCRLYFGLRLVGTEHIPAEGPLIITPNHQTFADPAVVASLKDKYESMES